MLRKLITVTLILSLFICLFAGCSGQPAQTTTATTAGTTAATTAATTAPGTTKGNVEPYTEANVTEAGMLPIVLEPEEFSLMIGQNANIIDFETNEVTKLQEERTGIHIVWKVVAEFEQSKNVALASGDLPDVFGSALTDAERVKYGTDGTLVDLTDYIENNRFWIKQMFEYDSSVKPQLIIPGGKIPAMPDYSLTYHGYSNQKGWIRKDWVNTLGLEYPDTIEDFRNVLIAFRDGDPNGNGQKDEIPFSGVSALTGLTDSLSYLLNAFIPFKRGDFWVEPYDGKQVDVVYTHDEWRDGLIWIHDLYQEGLIDPESFTQDSTLAKQKTTNDQVGFRTAHAVSAIVDTQSPIFEQFDIVLPLTGPSGTKVAPLTGGSGLVGKRFAITKVCKNPLTAFRWQDSMYDEDVQLWLAIGLEGKEWRKAEDGEVGINGKPALYALLERTYPTNNTWSQSIASYRTAEWRLGEASVYGDNYFVYAAQETRLYNATVEYMKYCPYTLDDVAPYTIYISADISTEYNDLKTAINEYVEQNAALFVTGDRDLAEWDAYCEDLKAIGLEQYLKWTQESIDAAK
jgi:putative aldouronate transport system substrate-binding protein